VADVAQADNYLMLKPQYALSYNRSKGTPNWVSWQLNSKWLGEAERQNNFRPDPQLPTGWYRVILRDYTNSGFDRGHLASSEDRGGTVEANSATFLMTNILPKLQTIIKGRGLPWKSIAEI
jgi:endonuclease G